MRRRRPRPISSAGPRRGVFGPFIPLLRSPDLMDRMQRVGEYLRFNNTIPTKLNEFAILITARHVTNQFGMGGALSARDEGRGGEGDARRARAQGAGPRPWRPDEALIHDFCTELLETHRVSDATYARAAAQFGEQGVVDLVGTVGYFVTVCLVMNTALTPPPCSDVAPFNPDRPRSRRKIPALSPHQPEQGACQ